MTPPVRTFEPDCGNCAGLCCVAFAFDRSEDFAHDKAADVACKHLGEGYRCSIHDHLGSRGYRGCVRFDCHGAGQRVTAELFGGGDWQKTPELKARMTAAFRTMRQVQELLLLLHTAGPLAHKTGLDVERQRLVLMLDPVGGWSEAGLAGIDLGAAGDAVGAFLRSLAGGVSHR